MLIKIFTSTPLGLPLDLSAIILDSIHMDSDQPVITPNQYRTHTNNQLTADQVGETVRLSGWVHSRRDHGGLIFIDLRDKWGITQLTFDPQKNQQVHATAEGLRSEFVIQIEGTVVKRPDDMVNENLATGAIEIEVNALQVLGPADALPFEISAADKVNEDLRLQYRFLDLRQPRLQEIMKKRDQLLTYCRQYMHQHGFTEVQTPILANSSPEGARDYLVPSRLHPGHFYALPQAPQQFKQLLMVAGLDRYFQIAPCFRDEDPRIDRHAGEFYQLDFEMSFVEQEDVFALVEPLMIALTESFSDKTIITKPFPRIPWKEAMTKYGTDKPDLRYDLFIQDVSSIITGSSFGVFNQALDSGGVIHALHVPGGAAFTRKDLDDLTATAKLHGAGGLAYIIVKDELASPIIKHLGLDKAEAVASAVGAKPGDAIFFGADKYLTVCKALGAVRAQSAAKLGLADPKKAAWCWVVDFPMYEYNEDAGKIDFSHNPFSMPQGGMDALDSTTDPTDILGYQYDLVLNGFEISSGAIRNHRPDIMYKAFAIAGYNQEQVDARFGGLIRAFKYGAPPHGGSAPGLDRLLLLLLDVASIRDVYAFPKNGKAQDVMMDAPSPVDPKQLEELHLKIQVEE